MNESATLAFESHIIVTLWVAFFASIVLGTITAWLSKDHRLTWPMLCLVRVARWPFLGRISQSTSDKMENASYSFSSKLLGSIGSWFIILFLIAVFAAAIWSNVSHAG